MNVRPATFFDALEFAGHRAFLRRALVFQVRNSEAFVVERDGKRLALAMFWRHRAKRAEFNLIVDPLAQAHMLGLVRLAQLTIGRVMQSGILVFAKVRVSDARARRMAQLVGFEPSRMADASVMIFRRDSNGRRCGHGNRQKCQEGEAGGSLAAQPAERGQCPAAVNGGTGKLT
jgi:hypothetical protein